MNQQHRQHDDGRAGALLLVVLALVLVAAAALLWLVLGGDEPDIDEQPEESAVVEPPPERPGVAPRLVAPHIERPDQPGKSMLQSSQRMQRLLGHLRKGASQMDDKAAKIKVTVKAPAAPQGINPEIWAPLTETLPGITLCYQRRLMDSPGLRGKLILSLAMVEGQGVARARTKILNHSTIKDPVFRSCVLGKLAGAAFPQGLAAAKEGAIYPLVFQPGEVDLAAPTVAGSMTPPVPPPPAPPPGRAPPKLPVPPSAPQTSHGTKAPAPKSR